jgi:hypothetical protein
MFFGIGDGDVGASLHPGTLGIALVGVTEEDDKHIVDCLNV